MKYSQMWYLSKIGFLDSIPEPAVTETLEKLNHTFHKRNEIIRTPESHRNELCFIKTGNVRLYSINNEGKQFTYSILGPGSTFGRLKSFSLSCDDAYVEAIENTDFCTIDEKDFLELANKYPSFFFTCTKVLSDRLQEREQLLKQFALGNVRERMIHLLQTLFDRYKIPSPDQEYYTINLPISQQELANMIGSSREAVSTLLNELAEEGLVKLPKRKQIDVHIELIKNDPNPTYIKNLFINQ